MPQNATRARLICFAAEFKTLSGLLRYLALRLCCLFLSCLFLCAASGLSVYHAAVVRLFVLLSKVLFHSMPKLPLQISRALEGGAVHGERTWFVVRTDAKAHVVRTDERGLGQANFHYVYLANPATGRIGRTQTLFPGSIFLGVSDSDPRKSRTSWGCSYWHICDISSISTYCCPERLFALFFFTLSPQRRSFPH